VVTFAACASPEERLTKPEFLRQANALCERLQDRQQQIIAGLGIMEGSPPTPSQVQQFGSQFSPEADETFDEISRLRPPQDDERQVREIVAEFRKVITLYSDAVRDEKLAAALVAPPTQPMTKAVIKASEYGMISCAF